MKRGALCSTELHWVPDKTRNLPGRDGTEKAGEATGVITSFPSFQRREAKPLPRRRKQNHSDFSRGDSTASALGAAAQHLQLSILPPTMEEQIPGKRTLQPPSEKMRALLLQNNLA